ncbi:hypothetical protein BaRGS_00038440, partial [Batillaria attramentaria]
NCECNEGKPKEAKLSYDLWGGVTNCTWTWEARGGGYVAVFQATGGGNILEHESSVIPADVKGRLGS